MLSAQSVMSNKMKIKKDHKHGPAMPCRIAATRECEKWPRWMRKGSRMGRAIPLHASQPRQTHGALLDAPFYERNSVPAGAGCPGKSGRSRPSLGHDLGSGDEPSARSAAVLRSPCKA